VYQFLHVGQLAGEVLVKDLLQFGLVVLLFWLIIELVRVSAAQIALVFLPEPQIQVLNPLFRGLHILNLPLNNHIWDQILLLLPNSDNFRLLVQSWRYFKEKLKIVFDFEIDYRGFLCLLVYMVGYYLVRPVDFYRRFFNCWRRHMISWKRFCTLLSRVLKLGNSSLQSEQFPVCHPSSADQNLLFERALLFLVVLGQKRQLRGEFWVISLTDFWQPFFRFQPVKSQKFLVTGFINIFLVFNLFYLIINRFPFLSYFIFHFSYKLLDNIWKFYIEAHLPLLLFHYQFFLDKWVESTDLYLFLLSFLF